MRCDADGNSQAKRELQRDPNRGLLVSTLRTIVTIVNAAASRQYKFLLLTLGTSKSHEDIEAAVADGIVTQRELRRILRDSGLGTRSRLFPTWQFWAHADIVMQAYDREGHGYLTREQMGALRADMDSESAQRQLIVEARSEHLVARKQMEAECRKRKEEHGALLRWASADGPGTPKQLIATPAARPLPARPAGALTPCIKDSRSFSRLCAGNVRRWAPASTAWPRSSGTSGRRVMFSEVLSLRKGFLGRPMSREGKKMAAAQLSPSPTAPPDRPYRRNSRMHLR